MDLELLANLKDQLLKAKEFHTVYTYFLDHFGNDRDFIALGTRIRHSLLEDICAQILEQIFKREVKPESLFPLSHLPEHNFIHGGGMIHGHLVTVMYFDDVDAGMMGITPILGSIETRFIRFSPKGMRGNPKPSLN